MAARRVYVLGERKIASSHLGSFWGMWMREGELFRPEIMTMTVKRAKRARERIR